MLTRTRIGLVVQAALTHPHMVGASATTCRCVFMLVFGVGCGAGRAGRRDRRAGAGDAGRAWPALLGPILFVVVVVGGLGSLPGAFVASLLIGLLQTFAVSVNVSLADVLRPARLQPAAELRCCGDLWQRHVAQVAPILPYLLLVLVLIFRPTGLLGNRET